MRKEHPDFAELVLTVNRRNTVAISTYKKAGFRDTGRLYHGGNSGSQHVLYLPLH